MSKTLTIVLLCVSIGIEGVVSEFNVTNSLNSAISIAGALVSGDMATAFTLLVGGTPAPTMKDMINRMDRMDAAISTSLSEITDQLNGIEHMLQVMMAELQLDSRMQGLSDVVGKMDKLIWLYDSMKDHYEEYDDETLLIYCNKLVSEIDDDSMVSYLDQMAGIISPRNSLFGRSIYTFFHNQYQVHGSQGSCGSSISQQQRIEMIHGVFLYYHMKGMEMIVLAYCLKAMITKKSGTFLMKESMGRNTGRLTRIFEAFKEASGGAATDITLCNPPTCTEYENVIQMKNLFTPIIIREDDADMNSGCALSCPGTRFDWKAGRNRDHPLNYAGCEGSVFNCRSIKDPRVCTTDEGRALWVRTAGNNWWGGWVVCDEYERHQFDIRDHGYGWEHCDTCACTCAAEYDNADAQKTMSLRPVISDIENNMVMTGMRWRQEQGVTQFQIQQAKLLPGLAIDPNTTEWKPIEELEFAKDGKHGVVNLVKDGDTQTLTENEDFLYLGKSVKSIHFDRLTVSEDHVVTGLKISPIQHSTGAITGMEINIRSTPFNYSDGSIDRDPTHSVWITPYNMESPGTNYEGERQWYDLTDSGENFDCRALESVTTGGNFYTDFTMSSWSTKGFGDPIIPLLDSRTISTTAPLGGIEVELRHCETCMGLVTATLYTKDISGFINLDVSEDNLKNITA